jgi:ketosteroid isomerase-like protein
MGQAFIETIDWLDATYEALSKDDFELFLSAFAPEARWNLLGHGVGLPFAGLRVGHNAIRQMIGQIYSEFQMRDFFIDDIIANERSAAVRWSAMATSVRTAKRSQIDVFDHIVFEGRQIVSLTQFYDTAAIAETAGRIVRAGHDTQVA